MKIKQIIPNSDIPISLDGHHTIIVGDLMVKIVMSRISMVK